MPGLRDHVFERVRPTFIRLWTGWAELRRSGLLADPRLARDYVLIWGPRSGRRDMGPTGRGVHTREPLGADRGRPPRPPHRRGHRGALRRPGASGGGAARRCAPHPRDPTRCGCHLGDDRDGGGPSTDRTPERTQPRTHEGSGLCRCPGTSRRRGGGIRTHGLLVPNEARYQAAPHPGGDRAVGTLPVRPPTGRTGAAPRGRRRRPASVRPAWAGARARAGWPRDGTRTAPGAYGEVPRPAETCRRMWAPQRDAPRARERSTTAVGDDRAVGGQAQLAAVGVAREHEVVAVGGERVEHPGLGGVGEPQAQVVRLVGRARDAVVVVAADVRVVDAADRDADAVDGQRVPGVRDVEPAVLEERGAQVAPRQLGAEDPVLGVEQVVRRVLRLRPVVVVAAPDDDARACRAARPARAAPRARRARWERLSPVFTTRSGSSSASPSTNRRSRRWPGRRCRSLTCSTRSGPAGGGDGVEDLEPRPAQGEPVPLDPDRVAQPERPGGGHARGGAQGRPRERRPDPSSRSPPLRVRSPRQGWRAARRRRRRRAPSRWRPAGSRPGRGGSSPAGSARRPCRPGRGCPPGSARPGSRRRAAPRWPRRPGRRRPRAPARCCRPAGSAGSSVAVGPPGSGAKSGFIALNQVSAGVLPPKMFGSPQGNGGLSPPLSHRPARGGRVVEDDHRARVLLGEAEERGRLVLLRRAGLAGHRPVPALGRPPRPRTCRPAGRPCSGPSSACRRAPGRRPARRAAPRPAPGSPTRR